MEILPVSQTSVTKAVSILKHGGVLICPTDTVYGFLTDATNKKAVEKIYKIKKRPKSKPLPVFVKDFAAVQKLAIIDKRQERLLKKYWPGKYTFVLERKFPEVRPRGTYGVDKKTIALRIPKHVFLQKLLKKINRPLTQTSVNISTQKPLNNINDIKAVFGKNKLVGLIINGGDRKKPQSSKVIDLTSKHLTRLR